MTSEDHNSAPVRLRRRPPLEVIPKAVTLRQPLRSVENRLTQRAALLATPAKAAPKAVRTPSACIRTPALPSTTSTIRQLRVALEDTPPALKELEVGWREIRRQNVDAVAIRRHFEDWTTNRSDENTPIPRHKMVKREVVKVLEPEQSQSYVVSHATVMPPTPPSSPPVNAPRRAVHEPPRDTDQPRSSRPHTPEPRTVLDAGSSRMTEMPPHPRPGIKPSSPKPIIAQPLSPTPIPVPVTKRKGETICIHGPDDSVALTLNIAGQVVQVNRSGTEISLLGGSAKSTPRKTLKLSEAAKWSRKQQEYWDMVFQLVEEFKRRTPRIKIYTPQGELMISCTSPPDILLFFTLSREAARFEKHQLPATRVRLRYALSEHKAQIDTCVKHQPAGDRFRSRRIVPLNWERRTEHEAGTALGIDIGDDWTKGEVEAVSRLWALREEWVRFVPTKT